MPSTILIALLIGVATTLAPFILTELTKFIQDRSRQKKIANANKADRLRLLQ